MNKQCWIFCISALVISMAVAFLAIPFASISSAKLAMAKSVVSSEELGVINLGEFGEVSVEDMANYYAENPPVQKDKPVAKVRFEGC